MQHPHRKGFILGLDVSTKNVGVAIGRLDDDHLHAMFRIEFEGSNFDERIRDACFANGFWERVMEVATIKGYPAYLPYIDIVAFEDRNYARNQQTNNMLNQMVGAIKALALVSNPEVRFIEINTASKLTALGIRLPRGSTRATIKKLTKDAARLICMAEDFPPPATEDEADALAVLRCVKMKLTNERIREEAGIA